MTQVAVGLLIVDVQEVRASLGADRVVSGAPAVRVPVRD